MSANEFETRLIAAHNLAALDSLFQGTWSVLEATAAEKNSLVGVYVARRQFLAEDRSGDAVACGHVRGNMAD